MNSPVIQGQVTSDTLVPSVWAGPGSVAAREFFNTVRTLIHRAGAYHNESDLFKALQSVDAYERNVIPASDRARVVTEDDRAPVEDVTLRRPAANGLPVQPASGPIDYAQLARAIVAAQAEQAREAQASADAAVHTITDVQAQ